MTEKESLMFIFLIPGAIASAVGLAIVRTVEAVEHIFVRNS
jgi:hypothetical protein